MAKTRHTNSSPTPIKKKAKEKEAEVVNAPMQHICRTCLEEIQESSLIPLNDSSSNIRNELRACIPEVDCDLIPNAGICNNCLSALHGAYQFKQTCLQTENKIRQQVHKKYTIDLNKLKKPSNLIVSDINGLALNVVYIHEAHQSKLLQEENGLNNPIETDEIPTVEMTSSMFEAWKDAVPPVNSFKDLLSNNNDISNPDELEYSCKHCDHSCDSVNLFILHLRDHLLKKYLCPRCDFEARYTRVLANHLKRFCKFNTNHKPKVPQQTVDKLCKSCGFTTQSDIFYEKHMETHCDQMDAELCPPVILDSNNEETLPMILPEQNSETICNGKRSSNVLNLEIDLIQPFVVEKRKLIVDLSKSKIQESLIHNSPYKRINLEANGNTFSDDTNDNDSEASDSLNFFCIHCNFSCVGMKSYRLHMSDHGGSRYICPCNFGTWRWQNFIMHVKRACVLYKDLTSNANSDGIVKRKCTRKRSLADISLENSTSKSPEVAEVNDADPKVVTCVKNGFKDIHDTSLLQSEMGFDKLVCSVCEYTTSYVTDFEKHTWNSHKLSRPYVCKDKNCHFSAKIKPNLMAHMNFHYGDKPFRCTECTYQAGSEVALRRHLKGHKKKT